MIFRSKRADVSITLLVVMVLVLCVSASFIFLTKQSSYERDMSQVNIMSETYSNEGRFILYFRTLIESVLTENSDLDSKTFIDKLQEKYTKTNIAEYNVPDFSKQILDDSKYQIEIKNNKLSFKLTNFEFVQRAYYDPSTKEYIFGTFEVGSSSAQETTFVKHVQDIVFDIDVSSNIVDSSSEIKKKQSLSDAELDYNAEFILGQKLPVSLSSLHSFDRVYDLNLVSVDNINQKIQFTIETEDNKIDLAIGETKKIDTNKDGYYDLELKLVSLSSDNKIANIERTYIFERAQSPWKRVIEPSAQITYDSLPTPEAKKIIQEKGIDSSWVDKLPSRPELAFPNYENAIEYSKTTSLRGSLPCGSLALQDAFGQLGKQVNLVDLIKERSGGLRRGFLSIFSQEASLITWPAEIKRIAEDYGYDVEVISGSGANIQTVRERTTDNSAVIIRSGPLFNQHYQTYNPNQVKRAFYSGFSGALENVGGTSSGISEIYIIKKRTTS